MNYGVNLKNIADLWSKPEYNSERINQLLFLEPVKIISQRKGYLKVSLSDQYVGWVNKLFISPVDLKTYKTYLNLSRFFVNKTEAKIFDNNRKLVAPYFLYYGSKLKAVKVKDNLHKIFMPHGEKLYISSSNLSNIRTTKDISNFPDEAKKFLGTPYLWGGISPAGFDCSGLVQIVLKKFGLKFPRDTKDQIKKGRAISRSSIKKGDLLFFKRHVAIALSKNRFIHSSIGNNGVYINSLDSSDEYYHRQLDKDFQLARRII